MAGAVFGGHSIRMTQIPLFADRPAAGAAPRRRRQVRRVPQAPRGVQVAFIFPATPCRCAAAPAPVAEVAEPAAAPAAPVFAPVAAAPVVVEALAPAVLVESPSRGRGEESGVAQVAGAQALTAQVTGTLTQATAQVGTATQADTPPSRGGLFGRVAQVAAATARRVAQAAGRFARSLARRVVGRRSVAAALAVAVAVGGGSTPTAAAGAARPTREGGVTA